MKDRKFVLLQLLVTGLLFHLVYIGTVFDCYFTSPVIHGMRSHSLGFGEAKRLVLIVADGLRADLLFALNGFPMISEAPAVVAPYLRSVAESRGAFGISHTHVPTESRPGHVALIGGMYEDVSAVTKGWKTNPVDFDSVFNQSSHTFSFGSPDILPMFAHGATPGKVDMWSYDEDQEDFTKDATALDVWVLDQLRTLLHNATADSALDAMLRQDKTVFFLHLLGLDTTGHSYRPFSREYMTNIQVVDEVVRQTEELLSEFYKDRDTSFVFTADHGMSKIGNHGDGDPDSTRTPLLAWGKGVRGPLPDSVPSSHDEYSEPWGLTKFLRHDIEQADVAPLMSALIGINWPVNSVGVLPDVDPTRSGYLDSRDGEEMQANAALVNAQVLLEQYRVKDKNKKANTLFYRPFHYFADAESDNPGAEKLAGIEYLIMEGQHNEARAAAAILIQHVLAGLRYLETYDRTLIQAIVTAAYLGWIAYCSVSIFIPAELTQQTVSAPPPFILKVATTLTLAAFWSLFAVQHSPWTYYIYISFPIFFWHQTLLLGRIPLMHYYRSGKITASLAWTAFSRVVLIVISLWVMVIGYTNRIVWSYGLVCIGSLWHMFFWPTEAQKQHKRLRLLLTLASIATAIFPALSVDKHEDLRAIVTGALCMLVAGVICGTRLSLSLAWTGILICQCSLIVISTVVTVISSQSLSAKTGLPLICQIIGWSTFLLASALPFVAIRLGHFQPLAKILIFFLAFSVCYIILSISVEGLFFCAFCATLLLWVEAEAALRGQDMSRAPNDLTSYRPQLDDLRIALFFLFYVQVAFFGTGNVASISSFYLEPVYRLVPVFSPFLMAVLLIFKIVAPYIILATCLHILNRRLGLPPYSLILVALTLTDVMTMTFFFKVTDTGSWLEIGQSISHFCIGSLLLVWAAGTCAVGELLMADPPSTSDKKQD